MTVGPKKRLNRVSAFVLAAVMLLVGVSPMGTKAETEAARESRLKVESARKLQESYETRRQEAEQLLDEYSQRRNDLASYIVGLDERMGEIVVRLYSMHDEIAKAEEELAVIEDRLTEAETAEQKQYETMKARVRYIYEEGETTILDVLLNAESLSDLLNSLEYVAEIRRYDNSLLERYAELKEETVERRAYLEASVAEMEELVRSAELERSTVEELMILKAAEINVLTGQMGVTEEDLFESLEDISRQEIVIDRLESEEATILAAEAVKKEAAVKAAEAAAAKSKTSSYDPGAVRLVELSDEKDPAKMIWPLPGDHRTYSKYGNRKAPVKGASTFHKGWDIGGELGAPVVAVLAGTVQSTGYNSSGGNFVKLKHDGTLVTVYCHFSAVLVEKGDYIQQGQVIGLVGSTGVSTGPHVHFGVVLDGDYVDPAPYIAGLE